MIEALVCDPLDLGEREIAAWRRLQSTDSMLDNAFLSPEFTMAVGRFRHGVRVAIFREGHDIVAFLPFQRGPLRAGIALGLGLADAHAVICSPQLRLDSSALVRASGLGSLDYTHLITGFERFAGSIRWIDTAPVIDVSDGYDAYLADANRQHPETFRVLRKRRRALEREAGPLEFAFSTAHVESTVGALIAWKSAQYERTGLFDRFSRRWIRDVVDHLACTSEPGCRGVLSTLSAGGRSVAIQLSIMSTSRISLWMHAFDRDFARYSPGVQLLLALTEQAPAHGIEILDLGRGNEAYKARLSSWTYPVAEGRVAVHPLSVAARKLSYGGPRRLDRFVEGHPRLRAHLPDALRRIDRVS